MFSTFPRLEILRNIGFIGYCQGKTNKTNVGGLFWEIDWLCMIANLFICDVYESTLALNWNHTHLRENQQNPKKQ